MNIEAFIIAWNEEETIAKTIRYYTSFCSKVTLFDNFSDDRTREIAEGLGAKVLTFGQKGILSDKEYLKIKNHVWKTSTADFVIVCDADEILWHPDLIKVLEDEKRKGVTIFKTFGWNVFSETIPDEWLEQKTGYHDGNFSKQVLFSPELQGINYHYGCHACSPTGRIVYSEVTLTMFHYRNVGGVDRLIERHKRYKKRLSPLNKELKLGHHYSQEEARKRNSWERSLGKSVEYSPLIVSSFSDAIQLNP